MRNYSQGGEGYCVDQSFNMITVDGDTSTNDMVAVLANGFGENLEVTSKSPIFTVFQEKLLEMLTPLGQVNLVSDGEGLPSS
jgi:glutamate N-acetyltransferase/amino-acid N-acetyltransferase